MGCAICASITACLNCSVGWFLRVDSICYLSCLTGTFPNLTANTCQNCPSSCATCATSTQCTSCPLAYFWRSDLLCYVDCGLRTYGDLITLTCYNCPYDCLTCNSNSSCITCNFTNDHRQLNPNTLRCEPAKGYYENLLTVAAQCLPSCAACLSITICTSCNPGYILETNQTCTSLMSCGTRAIFNNQTQACQKCPYDCFYCYSDSTCASCSSTDNRQLDLATRRCIPLSQYFDNKATVCLACPPSCLVCKSLTLCTVCLSGAFMSAVDHLCYTSCPVRQFPNN